jgi:hypothetical protein
VETIVGIFQSPAAVIKAIAELRANGLGPEKLNLLCPGESKKEIEAQVLTSDTEGEGTGAAFGGTIGGALGIAGGATLGTAVASLFVPGVGPILAIGLVAAALFGAGGAVAGGAAGKAMEHGMTEGLPRDELYIYEDALRKGRIVVIVSAADDTEAGKARRILTQGGAETIDATRENWWLGLRSAEIEKYERAGGDFVRDEKSFRRGFEFALVPDLSDKSFDQAQTELERVYPGCSSDAAFRIPERTAPASRVGREEDQRPGIGKHLTVTCPTEIKKGVSMKKRIFALVVLSVVVGCTGLIWTVSPMSGHEPVVTAQEPASPTPTPTPSPDISPTPTPTPTPTPVPDPQTSPSPTPAR